MAPDATDLGYGATSEVWMTANQIADLAGVTAATAQRWWRERCLPYNEFAELGRKSNRRSKQIDVETFLAKRNGQVHAPRAEEVAETRRETDETARAPASTTGQSREHAAADALDTVALMKAAAGALLDALINERERDLATLRKVREAFGAYDMALSNYTQPQQASD